MREKEGITTFFILNIELSICDFHLYYILFYLLSFDYKFVKTHLKRKKWSSKGYLYFPFIIAFDYILSTLNGVVLIDTILYFR